MAEPLLVELPRGKRPTVVSITPEQESKWTETRAALLWSVPMFSHMLYSMMNPSQSQMVATFTKEIPIAATDGVNLLLNPDTFFKYQLGERVFAVAHEISHNVYAHVELMYAFQKAGKITYLDGKSIPFDKQLWNIATDLIINDLLIECQIGTFNKEWLHDRSYATYQDSAVDVYRKLYDNAQKGGKGPNGKSFDQLLEPGTGDGKDATQAAQERDETKWKTEVAAGMASAKAQGKLPQALERMFGEILEPTVSWQDRIRAFFARKVGGGAYDWLRPDRRFMVRDIYTPARSGHGCGTVAVAIDTSGSIGQRELDQFFGELRGIIEEAKPQRVLVMWCDAQVHQVDEIFDVSDIGGLKPHGGGGTDFRPVFDWLDDNSVVPDALVYLTDGMGSFPTHAPLYPVLWGDIMNCARYPFGDVVSIPLKS